MEEDHRPLLPSKAVRRSSRRGLLPKVRVRLARIIKAFGRSASQLRRRKPICRLALFMHKASHCLHTSKIKGNPRANSSIPFHTRHIKGHGSLSSWPPHANNPLRSPIKHHPSYHDGGDAHGNNDERIMESLALLRLQTSNDMLSTPYGNPRLCKKDPFPTNHMALPCNPTKHAHLPFASYDDRLKPRIRWWKHRMNGTLTTMGSHKAHVPHDVPKGCVGVYVGAEQTRFVVPILHLNHPLFADMFECMQESYEFSHSGPLQIPCGVAEFETLHSQVKQLSKKHRWASM